jgi:subtilisin family serine protease
VRVLIEMSDVATARAVGRTLGAARAFDHVPALAAWIERPQLDWLRRQPGVRAIAIDEGGAAHLAEALPLAGFTPAALAGLTGEGITIAVIDSGIDRAHPDLAGAVFDEACFCSSGCCPGGLTEAFGEGSAADDSGHGTHVAGIIAGRGEATGQPGGAPAARVIAIKILDSFNAFCCTSDLVAALDWLIAQHPDVDLVNMSFGANGLHAGDCDADATVGPVASAAQALIDRGAVLVASSGNNGMPGLPSPACLSDVISVGAVWDADLGAQGILCSEESTMADRIACFSNFGPKLDLLAPGAIVTSTWPVGLTRGRAGTSQAAPMVSACAALLRQADQSASPSVITAALRASPTWLTDARNGIDYPRLDCGAALGALTGATDGGASEADAAIEDAGTPAMDAALEAGTDAEVEAGAPPGDATADGEDASAEDAATDSGELPGPDASDATAGPVQEHDAMAHGADADIADARDAGPPSRPRDAAADCACRGAGLRQPNAGARAPVSIALALGLLMRMRARRRAR